MGWSCRADASAVLNRITTGCVARSKSQNVWIEGGRAWMFELSRVEHDDGAITGSIHEFTDLGLSHARRVGGFRIEGDGRIARGPGWFKAAARGV